MKQQFEFSAAEVGAILLHHLLREGLVQARGEAQVRLETVITPLPERTLVSITLSVEDPPAVQPTDPIPAGTRTPVPEPR